MREVLGPSLGELQALLPTRPPTLTPLPCTGSFSSLSVRRSTSREVWAGYIEMRPEAPKTMAFNNEFFKQQVASFNANKKQEEEDEAAGGTTADSCTERAGRHHGDHFSACGAFPELLETFRQESVSYLCDAGHEEAAAADLVHEATMLVWSSIHCDGSTHPPHVHSDSMLSGVWYADLPSADDDTAAASPGQICFDDPRGKTPFDHLIRIENNLRYGIKSGVESTPPFHRTYDHTPELGQLIVFPSWLVHEVRPGEHEG